MTWLPRTILMLGSLWVKRTPICLPALIVCARWVKATPTPLFATKGVSVIGRPRLVGKNHLKMVIGAGASQMDAIAFGMADRAGELKEGESAQIDLLYQVQENNYFGRKAVQLNIKDFRAATS